MTQPPAYQPYHLPPVPPRPSIPQPAARKNNGRGWLILAGLTLAAVIGVAVNDNDTPAPASTSVAQPASPPAAPPAPQAGLSDSQAEAVFIVTLETANLGIEETYASNAEAIDLGYQVCGYLERGAGDQMGAALILVDSGFSYEQAGYTVGAATAAFCPEQG